MSPGGENLLDFLELRQVLSTYDWDLRAPLWWPQERPVPMRVARGPLGIPLPSMPGSKTSCGVESGTCSFLCNADMYHGVLLESPQGSQALFRVGTYTSPFERKHESPAHIQRSPVSASKLERRDPFPASSGKNSWISRRISRGGALNRKGERNSRVVPPFQ